MNLINIYLRTHEPHANDSLNCSNEDVYFKIKVP